MRATPSPSRRPRLAAPSGVTVRALARERSVTVHQVLMAIARGELKVRRASGRVRVTQASAAAWQPTRAAATPAAA